MGGNVCKELGIKPTKTIGTKQLDELWRGYAKGSNSLSKDEAMKFLKQFGTAIGVEYNKDAAEKWFNKAKSPNTETLDYDNFLRLFTLAVKEGEESSKVKLTSTLATKLNFSMDLPEEKEEKDEPKSTVAGDTYSVKCQGCKAKSINKVLYKCQQCDDYNLCNNCEQKADSIHDSSHYFIKIKSAKQLQNLPDPKMLKLTLYYYFLIGGAPPKRGMHREATSQPITISSDKKIKDLKTIVCGGSYGGSTPWGKSESLGDRWESTTVKTFDKDNMTLKEAGLKNGDVIVSHRPTLELQACD